MDNSDSIYSMRVFIHLIGEETIIEPVGTSFTITQFCPIVTLSPIFTGPIIFVPAPIKTLSPIIGAS